MNALKLANLTLRFFLEICLLVAAFYAGYHLGGIVVALVLTGISASVWGVFIAPKSKRQLKKPARIVLELVLFTAACGSLAYFGQPNLAFIFGGLVIINEFLLIKWKQ